MKKLILLLCYCTILSLLSCSNKSAQIKTYEDSIIYFSKKMAALADSGYSRDDSTKMRQETRYFIYETMRQHYIDQVKELKK